MAGSPSPFKFESLLRAGLGLGLGASATSWVGYDTGGSNGVGSGKGPVRFFSIPGGKTSFIGRPLEDVGELELIFGGRSSIPSAVVMLSSSEGDVLLTLTFPSLVEEGDNGDLLVFESPVVEVELEDDDFPVGLVTRGILSSGVLPGVMEDIEEVVLFPEDVLVCRGLLVGFDGLV